MNPKKLRKYLKNNESNISMILGLVVILLIGFFIIKNYNKQQSGEIIPSIGTEDENSVMSGQKYVVQKDDNLWNIATQQLNTGYDWKIIADANSIKAPYDIKVGQELVIPQKEQITKTPQGLVSPTITSTTTKITENTDEKVISGDTYVVVKGDNLWNIAVRSYGDGYKWIEIAKANNLKNPNIIHSGNVFVIPR